MILSALRLYHIRHPTRRSLCDSCVRLCVVPCLAGGPTGTGSPDTPDSGLSILLRAPVGGRDSDFPCMPSLPVFRRFLIMTWAFKLSLIPIMAMSVRSLRLLTSHDRCWSVGSLPLAYFKLLCHLLSA